LVILVTPVVDRVQIFESGGAGSYSGFRWALPTGQLPGAWVETEGALTLCRRGINACRVVQLPFWWVTELWEAELAEPITDAGQVCSQLGDGC
jgi:hypothetical protein